MPNVYTELYYHFIWGTKRREDFVTPELEPHLYRYIRSRCREMDVVVHALNGMPDHVHLAASLPPTLSIADFLEKVKGSSSHFANGAEGDFLLYWQPGYGALTFSKRDLPRIVAYIDRQKEHHASGDLSRKMERFGDG